MQFTLTDWFTFDIVSCHSRAGPANMFVWLLKHILSAEAAAAAASVESPSKPDETAAAQAGWSGDSSLQSESAQPVFAKLCSTNQALQSCSTTQSLQMQ